ncbi:hypothetical protein ACFOY4_09850 [Actinomadura syzygii]|uniref:Uncharacterized protein n=1 Tax=Actinomadura syzygii TaxID=1427538 RepID=A0A5D0UBX0_9ACTN|nr:hypothetical protein [Actinomadura syzygii]TYC15878.1 hypothetical protein FXF65_11090 [Actinomadura syzygii]
MVYERDCFSDQSFAIQITLTSRDGRPSVIRQVVIGGRPAGPFGLAPKSHLSPWLSFCDGLRADLVGQTLQDGLHRVLDLCEWAEYLPSQRLADALRSVPLRKVKDARTPAWWHAQAALHAGAVTVAAREYLNKADSEEPEEELEQALLQNLVAGYLHLRNTVPLSAFPVIPAAGPPTSAASLVRTAEGLLADRLLQSNERRELLKSLCGLLDLKALAAMGAKPEVLFDLELTSRIPELRAFVLADHIRTMEQAYPRATDATDFRRSAVDLLTPPLNRDEDHALSECFSGTVKEPPNSLERVQAYSGETLHTDDSSSEDEETGDVYERFAVQFEVDGDSIDRIYIGSRPAAPAGRHATAWVVLCDHLRALLVGKNPAAVPALLDTARTTITTLAGRLNQQGVVAGFAPSSTSPSPDQMEEDTPEEGTTVLAVAQRAAVDYLTALNSLDGSIVDTGGTSPAAIEPKHRATLLSGEAAPTQLAGMLDPRALAWKVGRGRIAFRIALHLHLMNTAYRAVIPLLSPECFAALLVPVEIRADMQVAIAQDVIHALDPQQAFSPDAYAQAADRYSHDKAVQAKAKTKAKPGMVDDEADYRASLESDDGGSSYSSSS